uniref:glucuronosyltransferase n=1 Tax=Anas platyrhynchos TaxID=8839 RepID=A0A8B9TTR2_ANAPL
MALVSNHGYLASAGVWVFLSLFCLGNGGKLLVVPMDGSHWLSMRSVLVALSQKEHEIVVVAPEVNLNVKASEYYTLKTYPVPLTREELGAKLLHFMKKFTVISDLYFSSCANLLHNKDLMQDLEGSKFDAVLTDPVVPCGQILALHLSIPSVFFLRGLPCSFDLQAAQCPDPPSYVPRTFTDNSDHMTFIQRVENLVLKVSESFLCNFAYLPFELLASDFLQRQVTMTDLLSHGSIWLKRMDFVFEYPMPLMPNIVFIGGINCGKKKTLPQWYLSSFAYIIVWVCFWTRWKKLWFITAVLLTRHTSRQVCCSSLLVIITSNCFTDSFQNFFFFFQLIQPYFQNLEIKCYKCQLAGNILIVLSVWGYA